MNNDAEIIAQTLYGEARGDMAKHGEKAIIAIANVIMNRFAEKVYGHSIKDVCLKPFQFSCWNINDPNRKAIEDPGKINTKAYKICLKIGALACEGALLDITFGANHYHGRKMSKKPFWTIGTAPCATIGENIFYKIINKRRQKMPFSSVFKSFFQVNFPELAASVKNASQEEKVEKIAQQITQKTSAQEVLDALIKNAGLMGLFAMRAKHLLFPRCPVCGAQKRSFRRLSKSEIMIGFATLGMLGCLIAVIFFRKSLPNEAINILSMIAGVFTACLKDAYGEHRSESSKNHANNHIEEIDDLDSGIDE